MMDFSAEIQSIQQQTCQPQPSPAGSNSSFDSALTSPLPPSNKYKRKSNSTINDDSLLTHLQKMDARILASIEQTKQTNTAFCHSLIPVLQGFSRKKVTVTNIFNHNINSRQKKNNGGGTNYENTSKVAVPT